MRYLHCLGIVLLAATPGSVLAQGFPGDVVPYPANGQITIGGYNHYTAPPVASAIERVHLYDFAEDTSDPTFITDPGFDNLAGFSPLTPGQALSFHLTTDLLYWDGTGDVSFSRAATPTSLALSLGSLQTVVTGTSVTGNFSTIQIADVNGRLHTHVGSTIADGSPEGIYLIGMKLSMPGYIDSKQFFILYNDFQTLLLSDDPADFSHAEALGEQAAAWTQDHVDSVLIPEPSSWLLAAIGAMAFFAVAFRRSYRRFGVFGRFARALSI